MLRASRVSVAPPGAGAREVVREFSLDLAAGEWVALTGENGSGKTTLALALAGLRAVRSGTIEFEARPVRCDDSTGPIADVAAVLQEPETQLLQSSVREELAFAARNRGLAQESLAARTIRIARKLGLDADFDRDPHTLSAGRQQLVLIAAALIASPRVLVLDEAGAHLDAANRALVLGLLEEERGAGLSILWISQERDELEAADRVIHLDSNRDTAAGSSALDVPAGEETGGAAGMEARDPGAGLLLTIRVEPWRGETGPRVAVSDALEIEVPARGPIVVEGPNGCGKSVLLAAAAGVVSTPQVIVSWNSRPDWPPVLAAQYPELQIFEERASDEVVFTAVARGVSRAEALDRARWTLMALGFPPENFLERRSFDLSAGEKRILQVTGALIAPASVLILDEPTAGLDPATRSRLVRRVRDRAQKGAVLVATQDREWAMDLGALRIQLASLSNDRMASPSQKTD